MTQPPDDSPRPPSADAPSGSPSGDGPSGSPDDLARVLTDQALRLMTSAQEWVRRGMADEGHPNHVGSDCTWCPLCQFVSVLRGEHPEVTQRVAEATAALVSAGRAIAESVATRAVPTDPTDGSDPDHPEHGPDAAPRVQHIDLDGPS